MNHYGHHNNKQKKEKRKKRRKGFEKKIKIMFLEGKKSENFGFIKQKKYQFLFREIKKNQLVFRKKRGKKKNQFL